MLTGSDNEGGIGKGGETKVKDENNVGCGCGSAWLRSGGCRVGILMACSLGVTKVAWVRWQWQNKKERQVASLAWTAEGGGEGWALRNVFKFCSDLLNIIADETHKSS